VYAKLEIAKDARISRTDLGEKKWKDIVILFSWLLLRLAGFVVAAY
jgi:hypothetical protein